MAEVSPPTGLSPLQANEDEAPLASHTYLSATRKLRVIAAGGEGAGCAGAVA